MASPSPSSQVKNRSLVVLSSWESFQQSPLIVALYPQGRLSFEKLCAEAQNPLPVLLQKIQDLGLSEREPLVLSRILSKQQAQTLYLTPPPQDLGLSPRVWAKALREALHPWMKKQISFHFRSGWTREQSDERSSWDLLSETLQFFAESNLQCQKFCLFEQETFAQNALLNATIKAKETAFLQNKESDLWVSLF